MMTPMLMFTRSGYGLSHDFLPMRLYGKLIGVTRSTFAAVESIYDRKPIEIQIEGLIYGNSSSLTSKD